MRTKPHDISAGQMIMMLFLCSIFTIFSYTSGTREILSAPAAPLVLLLSSVGALVVIIPFFLLKKHAGPDLLTAAYRADRPVGAVTSALFGLFCIYMAAQTTAYFVFLMLSTVYQNAPPWIFIVIFLLTAGYAASLGLESIARLGAFLFALTLVVGLLILGALLPEFELVRIAWPLVDGPEPVIPGTIRVLASNAEILLFILLVPRISRGAGKAYIWWAVLSLAICMALTIFLIAALGGFAVTRLFPLQTAATMARVSLFGRMDLFHILTWTGISFLRASAYLYCGYTCLRRMAPKLSVGFGTLICAAAAGVTAILTVQKMHLWDEAGNRMILIIPLVIIAILLPLCLLPLGRTLAPQKQADKKEGAS
ncbi:GerAB/ArcD/ProY family transporter [Anaerotruncus sp.]|uniref:GerAB/ArcD/ProY family transporter n=1 Tax=Anaerotruncus sp. TaxID=1872531 RepID=UPI00216F715E|nr:GerAB/ArcD/ProY family transporter [Anaerotruncus sp.]MCI8492312.1 GerAB/ArcD/ProY family transporter [Anaerotruncus sp.]